MFGNPNYNPINQLKDYIANDEALKERYPYRYWATLTYSPSTLHRMREQTIKRLDIANDEAEAHYQTKIDDILYDWRVNLGRRWFIDVAKEHKSHLYPFWGFNTEDKHAHFHSVILSERRLYLGKSKALWQHCENYTKEMKRYNPFQGAIPYIYLNHIAVSNSRAFCPSHSKACRKGRCPHREANPISDFKRWAEQQEVSNHYTRRVSNI